MEQLIEITSPENWFGPSPYTSSWQRKQIKFLKLFPNIYGDTRLLFQKFKSMKK